MHLALNRQSTILSLSPAAGRLPLLQSLSYRGFSLSSCNVFESAPRLSYVVAPDDAAEAALLIPYEQLTRLHFSPLQTWLAATALGRAYNLTAMTLSAIGPSTWHGMASSIELPRLRSLFIPNGSYLDFLVLPVLEDVWIMTGHSSLLSLIKRSSCSLRKFTSQSGSPEDILRILQHTPKLSELRCTDLSLEIISRLTIPIPPETGSGVLCSSLRMMHLICCAHVTDYAAIAQLMESRHESAIYARETHAQLRKRGMSIEWEGQIACSRYIESMIAEYP
ncbi:hypothetical protein C8J57DRAFT_1708868 [Mycena rebaudengoi]|nr:hypothetical protein C8J57DRAFT_1708868 [Mycena rebaudengoi]